MKNQLPNTWPVELGPVLCVVGARPNHMKMASILHAFAANQPAIQTLLVHTGQHYGRDMNDKLFKDLRLPYPDINIEVGSGSHAAQSAEVLGGRGKSQRMPEFWDGHTVERIAADLTSWPIEHQGRR